MCRGDIYLVYYACLCTKSSEMRLVPVGGCGGCGDFVGTLVASSLTEPDSCAACRDAGLMVFWLGMWMTREEGMKKGYTG